MDQTNLLHCVLMSVLLITVYGSTKIPISCPDQKGIVGKPLNLTCNVTCEFCKYQEHFFRHNGSILENNMKRVAGNHTYYYTIATATVNDSGNYTFWIQLSKGTNSSIFTVTIESEATLFEPGPNLTSKQDNNSPKKGQVKAAVVVVLIVFSLITVTIVVSAYRKRNELVQYNTSRDVEINSDDNNEYEI